MAEVELRVGGRRYRVSSADGQEGPLADAAAYLDAKAAEITRSLGPVPEARLLLMAALLVTGELFEARQATPSPPSLPDLTPLLEAVERLETLADLLEAAPENA